MIDHIFIFILGACVGSFLNVVIFRIPVGKSVISPGSTCGCGQPISWRDNVPIFSWFLLRGRARCCGGRFSIRYPIIELLTAGIFVALGALFPWWYACIGMVFASLIICAVFIDTDHMIIPDGITIGGFAVGLLMVSFLPAFGTGHSNDVAFIARNFGSAAVSGLVASGLLFWIAMTAEWVLKKEAMGFGDVKLIGMIGAFLGWKGAIFSIFGGAMLGAAWMLVAITAQKIFGRKTEFGLKHERDDASDSVGLGSRLSFGPMLGWAAVLYLLFAHRYADPVLAAYYR